jgi:eukaryotic-like serine/threonine-protein kinase
MLVQARSQHKPQRGRSASFARTLCVSPRADAHHARLRPLDFANMAAQQRHDEADLEQQSLQLKPGDVLGGRFTLEQLAGRGGMGVVYRGSDAVSGAAVAIKVATAGKLGARSRFAQETALLARLSHPGIVQYISTGTTPAGHVFLAMEWLEGETLETRLHRERLTTEQAVSVLRQSCEALAVAHAAGIVHRDLKPSNLFLVSHALERVKLLDFGIARQRDVDRTNTQTGTMLGTLGYMAPEQALGARELDARADVFALGCLLFECLTGRPAFQGESAVAIMAKVLHEDPPLLRQLRPELSDQLEALLVRMLSKDVAQRPLDAGAVLAALSGIGELASQQLAAAARPLGLSQTERKIVSVILGRPRTDSGFATTLAPETVDDSADPSGVQTITRRFGGELLFLRDGALMAVLSGQGAATDQTAQAARCALLLQEQRPDLRLSVATGRAESAGQGPQLPIGGAIDRASELLVRPEPAHGIAIDELTAALLEQSFVVQRDAHGLSLREERSEQQASRLLLGKPTPFVGRNKELSWLERTLDECIEDAVARVVLVLGAPGQGKSRLRHELVAHVRAHGHARVLMARADPVGAGSALLVARQLVRSAAGLHHGVPGKGHEQHTRLRSYLAALCPSQDTERLAEFLGELIDAPSPERPSPELRAARNDPQIMGVWLRRCFGQWLAAECERAPLLLVLEDLHWGDAASVLYLGEALKQLAARPLMVLALARPELQETFPKLWAAAEPQQLQLARLTPRAAERLVRAVLGPSLSAHDAQAIVERADGNPFHLEELIRRVAEGADQLLPETVLALIQTRLERLDPLARRCVRAASVFGETFWLGGLAHVLGSASDEQDVTHALGRLLEHELVTSSDDSRFASEREYRFRHGLLREAAYGMLTELDRRSGHALAGEWLEQQGEKDALAMAQHFELGAQLARAVPWLLAAAQVAADGGNVDHAIALAQRGLDAGALDAERGRLHLVHVEASIMRGQWPETMRSSQEAAACFPPGSALWFKANAGPLLAGTFLGDMAVTQNAVRTVLSVPLNDEATGPYGLALFWVCQALLNISQLEVAEGVMQRAEALAAASPDVDPVFCMWLRVARSFAQLLRGDLSVIEVLARTRELAERTGAAFGRALAAMYEVAAYAQTGHAPSTARAAELARAASEPTGLHVASEWASYFHALVYVRAGTPRAQLEAHAIAPLRALCERGDHRLAVTAANLLALCLLLVDDVDGAQAQTEFASTGARLPQELGTTLAVRAHIELHCARPEQALELAERGLVAAQSGIFPWTGSLLSLSRARALHALGRTAEAHSAIAEARDSVLRIADSIASSELRASFLSNIDANAHTLQLAERWLGGAA